MGGFINDLFGGGQAPSIEVADPEPLPAASAEVEPASRAVRDEERRRLRARRAFSGTLLTGSQTGGKSDSLL